MVVNIEYNDEEYKKIERFVERFSGKPSNLLLMFSVIGALTFAMSGWLLPFALVMVPIIYKLGMELIKGVVKIITGE